MPVGNQCPCRLECYQPSLSCPCILADLGECLICSHLQGEDFCGCEWSGQCIYIHYTASNHAFGAEPSCIELIASMKPGSGALILYCRLPENRLVRLFPLDAVYITIHQHPGFAKIPAVVLKIHQESRITVLALPTVDAHETYLLKLGATLDIRPCAEPAILGMTRLKQLAQGPVVLFATSFGEIVARGLVQLLRKQGAVPTVLTGNQYPVITRQLRTQRVQIRQIVPGELNRDIPPELEGAVWLCSLGSPALHKQVVEIMGRAGFVVPLAVLNNNLFNSTALS